MKQWLLQNTLKSTDTYVVPEDTAEEAVQLHFRCNPEFKNTEYVVYEICYPCGIYGIPKDIQPTYLRSVPIVPEQDSSKMPDLPGLYPDVLPAPKSGAQIMNETEPAVRTVYHIPECNANLGRSCNKECDDIPF